MPFLVFWMMEWCVTDVAATPFGLGSIGGLPGLDGLGFGSNNFMELQQNMQRELLRNPDMLRQLMDNPLVQQIMGDPSNMRQLILSNPQMQELIEVKKTLLLRPLYLSNYST